MGSFIPGCGFSLGFCRLTQCIGAAFAMDILQYFFYYDTLHCNYIHQHILSVVYATNATKIM